jgi:serine/threonine protein phosphatase PrpC
MKNTNNKINERNKEQNQKIDKIKLPFINNTENKLKEIINKNNLRNPQSANLSNKLLNNAIEIGKKIYNRAIITPNLVNIYSILEKENKDYISNNAISKSLPKNKKVNISNNNKQVKNKLVINNNINIIGIDKNKMTNNLPINHEVPIIVKDKLFHLNNMNINNNYLNSNDSNILNKNNNNNKNEDNRNFPNKPITILSSNKINKSGNLLKKIEIPYLKEKKPNLQSYNIINRKEVSKGTQIYGKIKINSSKKNINKRKFNSKIKIYDKKYGFINNIINNNNSNSKNNENNNNSNIKKNKDNLCFISYSYNEYPNIPYRKSMEDFHCIKQNLLKNNSMIFSYFSIFDGHSGGEIALFLSKNFHKILSEQLVNINYDNSGTIKNIENINNKIISSVKKAFVIADEGVISNLSFNNEIGSTGTIILLYKFKINNSNEFSRYLICANVGDSKGYILKKNNYIQITKDHKCTTIEEVERIKKCGGIVFSNRVFGTLMLTRSFGDKEMKKYGVISTPDCFCHKIREEDLYLIIASDGIWDAISEEEIMQMGGDKLSSDDFSKKIVKLAIEKGSRDNISCIVIKLNKDT